MVDDDFEVDLIWYMVIWSDFVFGIFVLFGFMEYIFGVGRWDCFVNGINFCFDNNVDLCFGCGNCCCDGD